MCNNFIHINYDYNLDSFNCVEDCDQLEQTWELSVSGYGTSKDDACWYICDNDNC